MGNLKDIIVLPYPLAIVIQRHVVERLLLHVVDFDPDKRSHVALLSTVISKNSGKAEI
jgi:hypothetical protein